MMLSGNDGYKSEVFSSISTNTLTWQHLEISLPGNTLKKAMKLSSKNM
jgi:hypothetical protein